MGVCPEGGNLTGTITGNVSTETSENVLNVEVELEVQLYCLSILTRQELIHFQLCLLVVIML